MPYIPSVKILIKSVVLTTLIMVSYFSGRGFSIILNMSDQYISGMWCAVSAIVVFDDLRENVKLLLKNRLLGTFIGSMLAVVCIYLMSDLMLSVAVCIVLVSIIINLLKLDGTLKIACTTVLVISVSTHGSTFSAICLTAAMRFAESALGCLMSLTATVLMEHSRYFRESTGDSNV
ncbi:MAG TPA: FUSC family protein [Chryseolinea sp.]|nr:FUSC family protein [Chryseolinea sp.]